MNGVQQFLMALGGGIVAAAIIYGIIVWRHKDSEGMSKAGKGKDSGPILPK